MEVDTGLLRAFVAVSHEHHFGRAAQSLFISQQALSKRIATLEARLGTRLLNRERGGATLTNAGHRFLPAARDALDLLDAAVEDLAGGSSLVIDVLDQHLAPMGAVRTVARDWPDRLAVVMRADATPLVEMLFSGTADVGLGRPGPLGPSIPDGVCGQAVTAEALCLLAPVTHPLAGREAVTMGEVARERIWFPNVGAPGEWTELLTELVQAFDLQLDVEGSTFGFDYWVSLIARGETPLSLIGSAMQLPSNASVVKIPIREPEPVFWWWAFWRRRTPSATIERLLDAVCRALPTGTAATSGAPLDPRHTWLPAGDRPFAAHGRLGP